MYPDAERALGRLQVRGVRLGLITDGPLAAQKAKVEALGLPDRFDVIILTDERGRDFWKPDPRAFREMADRLFLDPKSCVYVGDNPEKDFTGPAARPGGVPRSASAAARASTAMRRPRTGRVAAVIADLDALDAALDAD